MNNFFIFKLIKKIFVILNHKDIRAKLPHQWRSGSELKIDRREVPGSIRGRACLPSRSDFSVVFSEIRLNTG